MVIFVFAQMNISNWEKKKAAKQILSDFSVHEAENLRKFGNSYKIWKSTWNIVSIKLLIPGKCLTVLFKYHI